MDGRTRAHGGLAGSPVPGTQVDSRPESLVVDKWERVLRPAHFVEGVRVYLCAMYCQMQGTQPDFINFQFLNIYFTVNHFLALPSK